MQQVDRQEGEVEQPLPERIQRRVEGLQKFPRRGTIPKGFPRYLQCPKCKGVFRTQRYLHFASMSAEPGMFNKTLACPMPGCSHIFSPGEKYLLTQRALVEQGKLAPSQPTQSQDYATSTGERQANGNGPIEEDGSIRPLLLELP